MTTSPTSFGMYTSDGKYVRFDAAGNTRVIEIMKSSKESRDYMSSKKPVSVRVAGTANGDMIVMKEIK